MDHYCGRGYHTNLQLTTTDNQTAYDAAADENKLPMPALVPRNQGQGAFHLTTDRR